MPDAAPYAPALALASLAFVEAIIRLRLGARVQNLTQTTARAMKVVSARQISDHWKERSLPAYAALILSDSVRIFLYIGVASAAFIATAAAAAALYLGGGADSIAVAASPVAISFCCVIGFVFAVMRGRFSNG